MAHHWPTYLHQARMQDVGRGGGRRTARGGGRAGSAAAFCERRMRAYLVDYRDVHAALDER